jgi:hypothetical protein
MNQVKPPPTIKRNVPVLPAFSRNGIPSAEALQKSRMLLTKRMSARSDPKVQARRAIFSKLARIVADLTIAGTTPFIGLAGLHLALHRAGNAGAIAELGALLTGMTAAITIRAVLALRAKSSGEPQTIAEFVRYVRQLRQDSPQASAAKSAALLADLQEVDFNCPELYRMRESEYVDSYMKRIADAGRKPVRAEVRVAQALYDQERHEGHSGVGVRVAAT